MISRRHFLASGASALAVPALTSSSAAQDRRSLKAIAASKGFVFGAAAASYELKHRDFVLAALHDCAQLVPEYEMKRDALEPNRGQYNFTDLDALFAFAALNGLSMRGHPLVWYAANPPWLAPALQARRDERLMTGYIQTLMRRYTMASVDVVNEAIATDGNGLRPSPWLNAFGPRYIDMAFHAARAANPRAKLIYNDWGCEQGPNDRFRATTLKLLDGLIARRVPIDGLGLQGHLEAFGPRVDQKKLRDFLNEVRARGLSILVTELDVLDSGGGMPTIDIPGMPGAQVGMVNLGDMLGKAFGQRTKRRKMTVAQSYEVLLAEESDKLLDNERVNREATEAAEQNGIVFIDEIDKISAREGRMGADVSREGVQRDLLPLIEGTTVATKYGPVKTDHVLFIASGAFHLAKPSDLLPELQGRLPIRVELDSLSRADLSRILVEPEASLKKQYVALLSTEGVTLDLTQEAVEEIATLAYDINGRVENIGARRLQTVMEKLVEEISFNASDRGGETIRIDKAYVRDKVGSLVQGADLSRFIL